MAEFNLKSGNTTPFKMMGSSPLHAKSKLVSKANKPSEEEPIVTEPIVAESVSTSTVKPIVPTVTEEPSSEVPLGWFSGTGLMKKSMRKIPKKKNILQSFTDFLTSKIDKKQSLIR